ncbi:MAG: endonuclease III [Chloroflexi bacterium]|nr:endonuclease III [Chloroflexota bacterium]MBV9895305.1 endonuclease III [Chloroflexota bacterium]
MQSLTRWVHGRLLAFYGRPRWPAKYEPLDELVGTILSQHTSDINSERAFASLKRAFATWESVRDAPAHELVEAIRAGGLAVVKAQRIQAVLRALTNDHARVELQDLRGMRRQAAVDLLTALPGVGRKTAACVLLFGAHVPALPVDTHVHRVSLRLGLAPQRATPEATADLLEAALDPRQYYAFHVNLIRLGREICKAPRPRCEICPLQVRCASAGAAALRTSRGGRRYTASRSSASRAAPASNSA